MPLTYTGRNVTEKGWDYPSLTDIAVGLSRMPRFAGQTKRWWSVLDHVLFGDHLIQWDAMKIRLQGHETDPTDDRLLRVTWLLHDAHEALTSDVPSPFKGEELRELQNTLDVRIFSAYGASYRFTDDVKMYDGRALRAEAREVGPPASRQRIEEAFGTDLHTDGDITVLDNLLTGLPLYMGIPPHQWKQHEHPAVTEYLRRLNELL